jgi:hypothetical protein
MLPVYSGFLGWSFRFFLLKMGVSYQDGAELLHNDCTDHSFPLFVKAGADDCLTRIGFYRSTGEIDSYRREYNSFRPYRSGENLTADGSWQEGNAGEKGGKY